jgi:DNA (cytosine-5)-methyltransferase 1
MFIICSLNQFWNGRDFVGLTSLEICSGAGGQALGLEMAGFHHAALVEIDAAACATLRFNRPDWNVAEADVSKFSGLPFRGKIDLLAGGVPCPPFSKAGKQLGASDERDLFPEALRLVSEIRPKAVMLENVRGLLDPVFESYRAALSAQFDRLGYATHWRLLHASDFGVSQLRPRVVLVAINKNIAGEFTWPSPNLQKPPHIGELLHDLMAFEGWRGAFAWKQSASRIAPTLVGGSKKHGGPDLGPTRARKAWAELGVDGIGIADLPPPADHVGMPRLTVRMAARVQGFPDSWHFVGKKTPAYRQVGNAFPPPVAAAVGRQIAKLLNSASETKALEAA